MRSRVVCIQLNINLPYVGCHCIVFMFNLSTCSEQHDCFSTTREHVTRRLPAFTYFRLQRLATHIHAFISAVTLTLTVTR